MRRPKNVDAPSGEANARLRAAAHNPCTQKPLTVWF